MMNKTMAKFTIDLAKARPVETADGELTPFGLEVMHRYALTWIQELERDLDLEQQFPELDGPFYDIRMDPEYAHYHALP